MAATFPEKADPDDRLIMPPENQPEYEPKKERDPGSSLGVTDYMRFKLPTDEFIESQNTVEEYLNEERQKAVYADSLESACGYEALNRVLRDYMGEQVAYYCSEEGGALSVEEARARIYGKPLNDEEIKERLNDILTKPVHWIRFDELYEMNRDAPIVAQNLWEHIKREAQREFESGHLAANVLQPIERIRDAWNRARYLGIRESFIDEWKPQGGIELATIDLMVQSWLAAQFWMEESIKRSQLEPRREAYEYQQWKEQRRIERKVRHEPRAYWDIPYVHEQEAIEQAAQLADRYQRMYFRAMRQLREHRRYMPPVTINNPQQVNIAADGGQQINVSKAEEKEESKKIIT